ncbi:hypothetical protein VTO73DRAFT_11596 [Trametes versicolor]
MAPSSGLPQWDAPGMPPSISSDPSRGQTLDYKQYPADAVSQDPTTGYAESLYGPAVHHGDDQMFPPEHSPGPVEFQDATLEQSLRLLRQQENLRQRLRNGTQLMELQAKDVDVMAGRGQSVIQEFAAEVNTMRSRVNRIVGDNNKLLKEVERGFDVTKSLVEASVPFSSSTPRIAQRAGLFIESAPLATGSSGRPGPEMAPDYTQSPPARHAGAVMVSPPPSAPPPEESWEDHRDTPPHMHRSVPRSAPPRTGPTTDDSRASRPDAARHESPPVTSREDYSQSRFTRNTGTMGGTSEHVRFTEGDRGGSHRYPTVTSDHSEPAPVAPVSSKPKAFRLPHGAPISRAFSSYPPVTHNYTDRDPIVPLSVVGRPNPGTVEVVGHSVDTDGHREVMLIQLCDNIRFKTGYMSPPLPPGVKYPKIDPPEKYDGSDDHNVFYNWLDGFLTWLRSYNVCGPETDRNRVHYLRTYLTGKAVDWFTVCIDNPSLGYLPTFEETICAMHRRFVHSSSAAKATLEFEKCRYRTQDGIESFYAELMLQASRMVEPPDNYTIRHRLIDGLPVEMFRILTLDRNISAEEATVEEILTSVRQVEQGLTRLRHREYRDRDRRALATPATPAARPDTRNRDRSRSRERDRSSTPKPAAPAGVSAEYKPVAARVPTPAPSRPASSANTCYGCGQIGHYANDPSCPQYGRNRSAGQSKPGQRTRFHAQRVDMDAESVASTGFAPFELNYGYMPRMAAWDQGTSPFPGVQAFADRARMNLEQAHDAILQSRVAMTHHANRLRTDEATPFRVGDLVYLSTKNLALPKNRARKLAPKYIGPYKVLRANPDTSSYTLELPGELVRRDIPGTGGQKFYDFGAPDEQEWLVDDIAGHRWTSKSIEFLVHWSTGEHTWEPLAHCDELKALDDYLALMGVVGCPRNHPLIDPELAIGPPRRLSWRYRGASWGPSGIVEPRELKSVGAQSGSASGGMAWERAHNSDRRSPNLNR